MALVKYFIMNDSPRNDSSKDGKYDDEEEWKKDVKALIPEDWQQLFTIRHPKNGTNLLDFVLSELYKKYEPRKNGSWNAAPEWTKMFSYTSCPLEYVRAVVLLMEPLQP